MYIEYNLSHSNRAEYSLFRTMINITDIITSTQFAAVIALVATAVIVVVLRPKSQRQKQSHR
jgi:hypothetical protein